MPALKKGLSGLEPYEGKLSRTVLRGGSGGNITLLPGVHTLNSGAYPDTQENMRQAVEVLKVEGTLPCEGETVGRADAWLQTL